MIAKTLHPIHRGWSHQRESSFLSTVLHRRMITHWSLSQDLRVATCAVRFRYMNSNTILFSNQIITQEDIPSGTISALETRGLERHTGSISLTWWSRILYIIMECALWYIQKLKLKEAAKVGTEEVLISATIKTLWKERMLDTTIHWHLACSLTMTTMWFIWLTATHTLTQTLSATLIT